MPPPSLVALPPCRPHLPALAAAAVAVAVYAVTLCGTWVYDDVYIAHDDTRLAHVHLWKDYLTQGYFPLGPDNLWRPLTSLSFALQLRVLGMHAWPLHLVNILLHAAVAALVALLACRLSGQAAGYVAGILFAVHPVHVEAVAYLVGRAETVAALGVLAGLVLFLRGPLTMRRTCAIFGCFIVATLAKEQGLLLPPMLLVAAWLFPQGRSRANQWLAFLLTISMAAYIAYRNSILPWYWEKTNLDWLVNPLVRSDSPDRWLIPIALLGRYAMLLIAPLRLSPDYGAMVIGPTLAPGDGFFWAGQAALGMYMAALGWAFARRARAARAALLCLICLGMSYFLIANFILIGTIFGERLLYLPSAFVCILVGLAASKLRPRLLYGALTVVALLLGARAVTYAARWNDAGSFYAYALEQQPLSSHLYTLRAEVLLQQGDLAAAAQVLAQGRANVPESWHIWMRSAQVALRRHRLDDASEFITKAFHLSPGNMEIDHVQKDVAAAQHAAGSG